jgi:hypothetical protein
MVWGVYMTDRSTILKIKQNPSGPHDSGTFASHTWKLVKEGDDYKVVINQSGKIKRRRKTVIIGSKTAVKWLKRLQAIKIPLMPEVPATCDGSYYTFTFQGDLVSIELNWYNTPPIGAEHLEQFTEWLWSLVPDEWDISEDEEDFWNKLPL